MAGVCNLSRKRSQYASALDKRDFQPQIRLLLRTGAGYTWYENSRENKLTPWSNDPVSDTPGEILYILTTIQEKHGLDSAPIREEGSYKIRHALVIRYLSM